MKYIFGSGIVGLLAKALLPGDWELVPFGKSRFFSWPVAIDEDYIIRDDNLDSVMTTLVPDHKILFRKVAWSYLGQLIPGYQANCADEWLQKVFKGAVPGQSVPYLQSHMANAIYDISVRWLYARLQHQYRAEIQAGIAKGAVTEIGNHYFIRNGVRIDFDRVVSTIPHDVICKLAKRPEPIGLKVQIVNLMSKGLDLEGHDQVLVADKSIPFYKVDKLRDGSYTFYFNQELSQPARYLMDVLSDFDVRNGTAIPNFVPLGSVDMTWLKQFGFVPTGACAEWDWCGDVGTNILRILNLEKRA